jgi:tetratricopeptide (TPR) repeat protein
MKRHALFVILALLGLCEPATTWGQDRPETSSGEADARARELFENGRTLYEEGRYEDAIVAWEEAYRLTGRPPLLLNVANARERVGQYQQALEDLNRYRAYARAEERESLERRMRNLELRIEQQRQAPPAAVSVPAPEPAAVAPANPPPAAPPSASAGSASVQAKPTNLPAPSSGVGIPRLAGAGLAGLGLAGVVVGSASGLKARAAGAAAADACVTSFDQLLCPDSVGPLLQQQQRAARMADVAWSLAGLGLVGGGVLLFGPIGESSTALSWSIQPVEGRTGSPLRRVWVQLEGRF